MLTSSKKGTFREKSRRFDKSRSCPAFTPNPNAWANVEALAYGMAASAPIWACLVAKSSV